MRKILNKVFKGSENQLLNLISESIDGQKGQVIVTANPEIVMHALKDDSLMENLMSDESIITADGIGIKKACKLIDKSSVSRLTGVDISAQLLSLANAKNLRLMVYGSKQLVLDEFKNVIELNYPNVNHLLMNGYDNDDLRALSTIESFNPHIILVCLGVPRQEYFCYHALKTTNQGIYIGCGGSVDVLSGTKKRAPKLVQQLNIEWLYRIVREPKRIGRFVSNQLIFAFKVISEFFRN